MYDIACLPPVEKEAMVRVDLSSQGSHDRCVTCDIFSPIELWTAKLS